MIFRDGYRSNLPQKALSEKEIKAARQRDSDKKNNRKNAYNSSPLTKNSYFKIGDFVLVRNYKRRSKFDPYFLPEKFCVVDISANGNILLIENTTNGFCLQRHPNDIKLFNGSLPLQKQGNKNDCVDNSENSRWSNAFDFIARNEYPIMTSLHNRQFLNKPPSEGQHDYENPTPNTLTTILGHSFGTTIKRGMMYY